MNEIRKLGMKAYAEFSGYRGYHVWIFFSAWVPLRMANSLSDIILDRLPETPGDITLEVFPNSSRKKTGSSGQTIKLPFGIHLYTGKRSYLCGSDFTAVTDINTALSELAKYTTENLRRVIGANIASANNGEAVSKCSATIELEYEKLGNLPQSVAVVLKRCTLMQYLVNKAMKTGYLGHFERLSLLHVFGHLGEDGKEFVHTVMSYTLNYKYQVTQKFIAKIPEKPVSCIKLREQYKQVTAEYGCDCAFKRTKNCYPSPVIHAIKGSSDDSRDITIPTSRTLSREKKEMVYDELNVHVKVQELARNIAELKKQKRGIDKSIAKIEHELEILFDNANVNSLEIDMGILLRRKTDNGYEWIIEI